MPDWSSASALKTLSSIMNTSRVEFRRSLQIAVQRAWRCAQDAEDAMRMCYIANGGNNMDAQFAGALEQLARFQRELIVRGTCPFGFAVTSAFGFRLCVYTEFHAQGRQPLGFNAVQYGVWPDCHDLDSLLPARRRPGCTVIEIGANIGFCSLYYAARGHHAVAIEPDPANIAVIEGSLGLVQDSPFQPYLDVHLVPAAAGNTTGTVSLFLDPMNDAGHSLYDLGDRIAKGAKAIEVPSFRVDDLGLSDVCGILLDAEGNEMQAMLGSQRLVGDRWAPDGVEVVAFEWNPASNRRVNREPTDILDWFHKHGFKLFKAGELHRSWPPAAWPELLSWAAGQKTQVGMRFDLPRSVDLVALRRPAEECAGQDVQINAASPFGLQPCTD